MKLKRCENGHFYDQDKFAACPHCAAIEEEMDNETQTLDEQTMSIYENPPEDMGSARTDDEESVTIPADSADVHRVEIPEPEPNRTETQMTEPERRGTVQERAFRNIQPEPDYDDDPVTVGLFGDPHEPRPVVGWLVCIKGEMYGQSFPLHAGKNFVGRGANMDVVIRGDRSVSRDKHAIIIYEPRRREFIAQAGESRELFYLNDEVVLSMDKLKNHDVLTIGRTDLMFVPLCGEDFSWEDIGKKGEE